MPWQPAAIRYPDAEQLLCDRTRTLVGPRWPGLFVSRAIPNPRREQMVIWNRDGGNTDGATDHPRMRCRVWAKTDKDANDLARDVVALMPLLGQPVTRVEHLSGPYEVPDDSGQAQRYLLFQIDTEGAPP